MSNKRQINNPIILFFNRIGKMIDMFVYHAIIAVLHLRINRNWIQVCHCSIFRNANIISDVQIAHVAELVDAHGSGPCAARCGGSNPSVGTIAAKDKTESLENIVFQGFFVVQKQNSSIQYPNPTLKSRSFFCHFRLEIDTGMFIGFQLKTFPMY